MKRRIRNTDRLLLILFIALLLQVAILERGEVAKNKGPRMVAAHVPREETPGARLASWGGRVNGDEGVLGKKLVKARVEVFELSLDQSVDLGRDENGRDLVDDEIMLVGKANGRVLTFEPKNGSRKSFERL